MGARSVLLSAYVQTIYVPSRIELARQYVAKLYSVAAKFSEFLGHPATLGDLTDRTVCDYLTAYRQRWSSRATNNQRQVLLSLWQDAADRPEFLPLLSTAPNPRRIRKLPEERDPPTAWTFSQVVSLMDQAACLSGWVGDVPAGDWWLSLFDSIYWTSNRITAMLAVPSTCYDGEGILVRKQKNNRPQWFPLPGTCREIIERTRPGERNLLWEHPWHPRTVWTKAREIIEAAGLPCPRTGRNLFHKMRRTTITLCAVEDPIVAQRTAGHKDYATTLKSYIDPHQIPQRSAVDVLADPLVPQKPHHPTPKTPRFRIVG